MALSLRHVGMIGFGEAGGIIGADLAAQGCTVRAYDILYGDAASRERLMTKAAKSTTRLVASLAEAVQENALVICAVTASSAHAVAKECAGLMRPGQYYLDINSVSPQIKRDNAANIAASGALYVEAAVMAPVPPQRLRVPMLLGGAQATVLGEALRALGMNVQVVSEDIGVASAIKMCRSVLIKGLEALTVECLFAARRYGAEDAVLASLHASFPSLGWNGSFPDYLVSRVAEHGRRRAAEMREVAETLREVGIDPLMANATALRQDALVDAMADAGQAYASNAFSWRSLADVLQGDKR